MGTKSAVHGRGVELSEALIQVEADKQRVRQAVWVAMAESGPYPQDEQEFKRWVAVVDKKAREVYERVQ